MLDLYHADRQDLLAIIGQQQDRIADLERQLAHQGATLAAVQAALTQVTKQLGAQTVRDDAEPDAPQGMPGHKPTQAPVRSPRPRKRRLHHASRHRLVATRVEVHALAQCPHCQAPLSGGTPKRSRQVIELPTAPVVVTEHVYLERRCPDCGRRLTPPPALTGMVCGQSRLGIGLVSLIATLREEARLPYATIQWCLATVHGVRLSVGALVDAVRLVAQRAAPVVAQFGETIRASPVVHADETGWRENGRNGYVWTFSTPDIRWFLHGNRAKAMLARGIGDAFGGVLVSDFYAVYTSYEGLHQYCWAHLLRDLHDLTVRHPQNAAVLGWAVVVQAVFARAQAAPATPALRRQLRQACARELRALCQPWLEPRVPQTTLCQRILKHLESLFVFVTNPTVPATNNAAERSLRPLVTSRKISGGTRSPHGTQTKMTLASLFGTWRVQGRNPLLACRELLATPQT